MPLPSGIGSAGPEKGRSPGDLSRPGDPVPTGRHAIPKPIRCSHCKRVGLAFFEGGFNVKVADKAMNGRVFIGDCGYCKRTGIELIPLPNLTPSDEAEFAHLYKIQKTLEKAAEMGWQIPRQALMLPLAKVEELHRKWAQAGGETP